MPARPSINVFTPLPPSPTDIANVNLPIIGLLSAVADVTVWTPQEFWDPLADPRIEVRSFRGDAIAFWELNSADANIFHIGNNREMHEDIFDVARRVPGLVVLHDVNLHDFALEMFHAGRVATYNEILLRCHGEAALGEARHALAHGGMDDVIERWPCTLAPATRATGILTHNEAAATWLRDRTDIPVFFLPLPFADAAWPEPPVVRPAPARPYRLVVFGFLGRNRRVEEILRVLAGSPLRDAFRLSICGSYHDPAGLDALIDELELADIVEVEGFVPFPRLNQAIAAADLALNLRNPTVGEASGSQLRIWANGTPSVVSDHGWYAGLPADCVHSIDPGNEREDLMHLLVDLCCRPGHYRRLGEAGRRHVRAVHDPEGYVAGLLDIVRTEAQRRRAGLRRRLGQRFDGTDRFGETLAARAVSALFPVDRGMPAPHAPWDGA